jgi:hypothetical protein
VPRLDEFTYTTAGVPLIAHSWLAEVVFYGIDQIAGTPGFMGLRVALLTLALLCAIRTARLLHVSWPTLMLLAPLGVAA